MNPEPLAERLRPSSIEEMVGQQHLLGNGQVIRQIIKQKRLISLLLWGPPGSGKTTLARIIAKATNADFIEISAVSAGLADVKTIIKRAEENRRLGGPTILFVDEIHRFNKAQQDAFLPHVETGLITLIGATTENPSFEVIGPLLSRSRVIVLEPIAKQDMVLLLKRVARAEKISSRLKPKAYGLLAEISGGDARIALNTLELALSLTKGFVTADIIQTAAQRKMPGYDKTGEAHYNLVSAFIKSLRGSDASAALYYLARMLAGGEDPKFISRRMIIFASEDIGIAASAALNLTVSTFQAVERIGLPECQYNLFHCALVLAKAEKSRVAVNAMSKAIVAAKNYPDLPVPLYLRNTPTRLMKDLGYGENYRWRAGFKHEKGFLPNEMKDFSVF